MIVAETKKYLINWDIKNIFVGFLFFQTNKSFDLDTPKPRTIKSDQTHFKPDRFARVIWLAIRLIAFDHSQFGCVEVITFVGLKEEKAYKSVFLLNVLNWPTFCTLLQTVIFVCNAAIGKLNAD